MVDLVEQYRSLREDMDRVVLGVLEVGRFVRGPECDAFERELADYCGVRAACGVASGTDALRLTLWALGVGPGDEVVTAALGFIATAEAIVQNGARPVFVDVDPERYTMDPQALSRALTPRTKVIIPVHLYGQPADMAAINAVASGIPVIEDAAHAHGATLGGRRAGALGTAGCFSFYPGKNLGAYGDAGAVVSDDEALVARVRALGHHGAGADKYDNRIAGTNSRLDALQAAVLRLKLRHLDEWNDRRRELVGVYREELAGAPGLALPVEEEGLRSAWHLFVVRTANRDGLREHLAAHRIASSIHYPVPLHLVPAMLDIVGRSGALPVAERLAREVVSLPLYPELPPETARRVAGEVRTFLGA